MILGINIFKVFYPKDMRHHIKRLEAEQNLNAQAIYSVNRKLVISLIVAFIISFFDASPYYIISIISFLILSKLILWLQYHYMVVPYSFGTKEEAKISSIYFEYAYLSWRIVYEYEGHKKSEKISDQKKQTLEISGDFISIMKSPDSNITALYIPEHNRKSNLAFNRVA